MQWYVQVLKKYAVFEGCAKRQEFWTFVLVNAAISLILIGIEEVAGTHGVVRTLFGLAMLFPSLAVTVRRLHDTGRSGWWILIGLIPVAGAIVLFVYLLEPSQADDGRVSAGEQPRSGRFQRVLSPMKRVMTRWNASRGPNTMSKLK
jgi:uncharacterized membrane protein YhaH (DUF805 family)